MYDVRALILVKELERCLLKAQSAITHGSGGYDCAFLLPLVQGQIEALRATAEDRQKDRADNQALHGAIVSPLYHKEQSL